MPETVQVAGRRVRLRWINLACCGVDPEPRLPRADGAPELDVVVVAGTVTRAAHDEVSAMLAATPQPRLVVAYGVCTISGGPYWDSYSVVPGIAADLVVPGCPPRPGELIAALQEHLT